MRAVILAQVRQRARNSARDGALEALQRARGTRAASMHAFSQGSTALLCGRLASACHLRGALPNTLSDFSLNAVQTSASAPAEGTGRGGALRRLSLEEKLRLGKTGGSSDEDDRRIFSAAGDDEDLSDDDGSDCDDDDRLAAEMVVDDDDDAEEEAAGEGAPRGARLKELFRRGAIFRSLASSGSVTVHRSFARHCCRYVP